MQHPMLVSHPVGNLQHPMQLVQLDKADVIRVLPEALAAHVEPVFTDQTVSVRAYPAGSGSLTEFSWVTPVEALMSHLVSFE